MHKTIEPVSRDFVLCSSPWVDFDKVTDSRCAPAIAQEGTSASYQQDKIY